MAPSVEQLSPLDGGGSSVAEPPPSASGGEASIPSPPSAAAASGPASLSRMGFTFEIGVQRVTNGRKQTDELTTRTQETSRGGAAMPQYYLKTARPATRSS